MFLTRSEGMEVEETGGGVMVRKDVGGGVGVTTIVVVVVVVVMVVVMGNGVDQWSASSCREEGTEGATVVGVGSGVRALGAYCCCCCCCCCCCWVCTITMSPVGVRLGAGEKRAGDAALLSLPPAPKLVRPFKPGVPGG
jgi:hypothetical protein